MRRAERTVDHVVHLLRCGNRLEILGSDVLEQRVKISFLLRACPDTGERLLTDDRDERLVVELRILEPVEHMNRPRSARHQADADLPGELGVCRRHESCELFMRGLNKIEAITGAA